MGEDKEQGTWDKGKRISHGGVKKEENTDAVNRVFNVAFGKRTTLKQLFEMIKENLIPFKPEVENIQPDYGPFRKGDVRHSLADINLAIKLLGYSPAYNVADGMKECISWYVKNHGNY